MAVLIEMRPLLREELVVVEEITTAGLEEEEDLEVGVAAIVRGEE